MNFSLDNFTNLWLLIGGLVYGWVMISAVLHARWSQLANSHDLNILLYIMLAVYITWSMYADLPAIKSMDGLNLHLLCATLVTLMFGWAFAILVMNIVLVTFMLMATKSGLNSLIMLPWNGLITCILPVVISWSLFRFVDQKLPNNFFIYIFICAFFGAALSIFSVVISSSFIHYLSGGYSYDQLSYSYLPYGLILMFPEAFISGMFMTVFVVYRPQWVSTFDDSRYLRSRNSR